MIRVTIVQFGNQYAIVERDGVKYKIPLESLVFAANPRFGFVERRELTRGRIIEDADEE